MKVLPRAIAWMVKDSNGFPFLYQCARNMSLFIDSGDKSENGRRLKQQKMLGKNNIAEQS